MADYNKALILIVDDEEMVRMALEMILVSEGYDTVCAVDGLEAIDIIGKKNIDLVITDIKMPRADGLEVLRAAKANNPATKVIMITGFTSEDPTEAMNAGADEFIYKVFKRDDILQAVRRLLSQVAEKEQEKKS